MYVKLVRISNEKNIVEPMPYTTVIFKVTQNENSWAADDLICFISDFCLIWKQSFEQKHWYLCPLFDESYSSTGFENGGWKCLFSDITSSHSLRN